MEGLEKSTGGKDSVRSKGTAMKAGLARAGNTARNHADYLFLSSLWFTVTSCAPTDRQ